MGDRLDAALANAASPGTIAGLHAAIKARLSADLAGFDGLETKTATRAPQVVDGWLPPKDGVGAQVYPFVLVRPSSGSDTEEGIEQHGEARVRLIVGVYGDDDDTWLSLVHIIDAIRLSLDAAPSVGGSYDHVGPLTWEIPDEQPRPEWIAYVTTNWYVPRPLRVDARNPGQE